MIFAVLYHQNSVKNTISFCKILPRGGKYRGRGKYGMFLPVNNGSISSC